jgi:hypothetical protein
LARAVMQLPPPTAGTIRFEGQELTGLDHRRCARPGSGCRWSSRIRSPP